MKSILGNTRGQYSVSSLGALAILLVTASIVIAIGGQILADVQTEFTANTYAYNATGGGLEGIETFGSWLDTIALIIVAAVVIGIIVTSFSGSRQ